MNIELGAGKIRFLPKEKGLRMITNMRNSTKLVGYISVYTNDYINKLFTLRFQAVIKEHLKKNQLIPIAN